MRWHTVCDQNAGTLSEWHLYIRLFPCACSCLTDHLVGQEGNDTDGSRCVDR